MAGGRALGEPVVDAPAALDRRRPRGPARDRRRDDRLAGLFVAPARREDLHVLDEIVELGGGDVPRQHRGAVQAVAQRAHEVGVVGQLAGGDRGELVDAQAQIARRRAQAAGGRALAVARVAVAGAAEVRVDVAAVLERAGRDAAAAQRDGAVKGGGAPARRRHAGRGERRARRRPAATEARALMPRTPRRRRSARRRRRSPCRSSRGAGGAGASRRAPRRRSRTAIATRPPSTCSAWNADSAKNTSPSAPVPGPRWPATRRPHSVTCISRNSAPRPSAPAAQTGPRARARRSAKPRAISRRPLLAAAPRGNGGVPGGGQADACAAHDRVREQQRREQHRARAQEHRHADGAVRAVHVGRGRLAVHDSTSSCAEPVLAARERVGVAELVRPAHDDRDHVEVVVRRRRRRASTPACRPPTGSRGAGLPRRRLTKKFTTKISCAAPSTNAACEIHWFSGSRCCRNVVRRRVVEAPLHARVADQQLAAEDHVEREERRARSAACRAARSSSGRTSSGTRSRSAANDASSSAAAMVRWKCPTTKKVSCRYMSATMSAR